MVKGAVRHGDPTTTGGVVLAFSSTIFDGNKQVALSGDEATCGHCDGIFKIFGTGQGMSEQGRDVVVDGDLILYSCRMNRVIVGANPGIWLESSGSANASSQTVPTMSVASGGVRRNVDHSDRHTLLDQASGKPIANTAYAVKRASGAIEHGITDVAGRTHMLPTLAQAEAIEIYLEG